MLMVKTETCFAFLTTVVVEGVLLKPRRQVGGWCEVGACSSFPKQRSFHRHKVINNPNSAQPFIVKMSLET